MLARSSMFLAWLVPVVYNSYYSGKELGTPCMNSIKFDQKKKLCLFQATLSLGFLALKLITDGIKHNK